MRILQVTFKNLNSLAGEWSVDFTHPAYTSDGVFAITGPTGAGKTTILDAICLALYGSTPRLGRITKSGNEIMSRQTGECFAEVAFETQAGRFRCHWSQHRSRKKPDGELQAPKHEICEADSGKIIESRLREVVERIESVTGMDFDRFTRSMLLAQGGFATFLQAPPDERAPVLEQITGTEIYSHISIRVHERRADERRKLETMQAELTGTQLLDEQEEQTLHSDLQGKLGREVELTGQREVLHRALAWLDGIGAMEKDLAALQDQWQDFEKRQQAFQPESERLVRARKTLGFEGDYARLSALREQQNKEMKALDESRVNLPAQEAVLAEVVQAQQIAQSKLNEARAVQKNEAEIIKNVREIDLRIKETQTQIKASVESVEQVRRRRKDLGNRKDESEKSLKKSHTALKKIEDYLSGRSVDAGLVENLTAIRRTFEALRAKDEQHSKVREALAAAYHEKEISIAACSGISITHGERLAEFTKAEQEYNRLTETIAVLLKERDLTEWRSEWDAWRERKHLLDQTGKILERITGSWRTLDELRLRGQSLAAEQARLAEAIESLRTKKTDNEREIAHLEEQAALLNRIRNLDGERARLEDGQPCPLCGAMEHPFAKGNVPAINETESELKDAKNELRGISDSLAKLQIKQAETEKDIKQVHHDTGERIASLDSDERQCAEALIQLEIDAMPEERLNKVHVELAGLQVRMEESSKTIKQVEQAERKQKGAQKTLDKARTAFLDAEKNQQEAVHKREIAERDHERLAGECQALAEQVAVACSEASQEIALYGVRELSIAELDGILESLTRRRHKWQAKQTEKAEIETRMGALKTELEKQDVLLSKLDEELQTNQKVHDELCKQFDSLKDERRGLYGDRNPDDEEENLANAVERGEKTLEEARADYGRVFQAVSNLNVRIAALDGSTRQLRGEILHAEQLLRVRLAAAGFEDETDYKSACVPAEEMERLTKEAEALQKERTELETRRKDKTAELTAERGKMVTERARDTLREDLNACEENLRQIQQDIGALKRRLADNENLRAKQQARFKSIEAQRKECMRWDQLHELIGSADGKKYRNFAQGLTFEMMAGHANRQLRKMSDRYLLVRDETQPLELNVIDNYQAGEIRSTKNLSGGESFIVSLALALGLSHMASRNVAVDSLFLDEGFGTLDEDALETALETLAGLQQDGKLIGVISHVPALKERIGTQIQVTPLTGGRSNITGPGCSHAAAGNPQTPVA
ncbi:MAG: AAA family ATPase [Pseudomonadota bacterium]